MKTITALTIAALAEASAPYGIESFDDVLEPLWKGIRLLRGKVRTLCARFVLLCYLGCESCAVAVEGHPPAARQGALRSFSFPLLHCVRAAPGLKL